jgi:hypothetical protein
MKYWRGDYVIVFPGRRVKFHKCVVCGRNLKFDVPTSESGVGPECARKLPEVIEQAKQRALRADRERYRREVLDLGFTIE